MESDSYNFTDFEKDRDLLAKIQSGKGDPEIYGPFYSIYVESMFGGKEPETVDQDIFTGRNNIKRAKAASWIYIFDTDRVKLPSKYY